MWNQFDYLREAQHMSYILVFIAGAAFGYFGIDKLYTLYKGKQGIVTAAVNQVQADIKAKTGV